MKKNILLLTAAIFLISVDSVYSQSWKNLLSGATKVVEQQVTGNAGDSVNVEILTGTWEYSKPAIKLESDDVLANVGAEAVSATVVSKLEEYYKAVGIKEGCFAISFSADGVVSTKVFGKELKGTYTVAEDGKSINIGFTEGGKSFAVQTAYSGGKLSMLMGGEKLMSFIQMVVEKIPASETVSTISAILKEYKDIKVGFEMTKKAEQ